MVGRVTLGHDAGGGGPPLLGGRRNRRTRSGAARFGDAGGMSGPGVNKVTKQAGAGGLRLAAISHGEVDESVLVCSSSGGGVVVVVTVRVRMFSGSVEYMER